MQKLIRTISTILLILIIVPGFAQQKELTLKDAVYMNRDIFPKRINQLNWMGKSDSWSYVENDQLMKSRATVNDPQTIVTLDDLNAGMADLQEDSVKRFPQITYINDHRFYSHV